jgi:catechol 2,3-dioxygenase-like lactoylglutathione lyase family enzyme
MIKIQRLGHATIETPELERAVEYHQQLNGLNVIGRDGAGVHLATKVGQLAMTLVEARHAHCSRLSFEVAPDVDFAAYAKQLTTAGIASQIRSDPFPGTPQVLTFNDCDGTTIDLFREWKFHAADPRGGGLGPLKLGHMAFFAPDVQRKVAFYRDLLSFRVSDWIGDHFVFMRCNSDHHTVNFFQGDGPRLHHMAFELKDFAHMQNACEWLGQRRIAIDWGPVRLGPGHNVGVFHRNADGQMTELYIELDQMKDEELGYFDPRPWHRDRPQRPKVWPADQSTIWGPGPPAVMRPSA